MKQIAEKLGLSVQSVSLALNDRKGVSEKTRKRVKAYAAKVGYRPDPGLRALAEYRTGQQKIASRWNVVALLHNWPTASAIFKDEFYGKWFKELEKAATDRGIKIEPYWLGENSSRTKSVFRTLRNRGITGVFYAPPSLTNIAPTITAPHSTFQVVTFGPEHLYPDLHTIQFDFYENLRLAWKVLRHRGRNNIGLLYAKHQGWRTGHAWRAAYHIEKLLAGGTPGTRMPLELDAKTKKESKASFIDWVTTHQFDAVISSIPDVAGWTDEEGLDCEIAIFNVCRPDLQGIDLNLPQMANTAIDLLNLEMQRSLRTGGGSPFRIHIPGRWVEAGGKES